MSSIAPVTTATLDTGNPAKNRTTIAPAAATDFHINAVWIRTRGFSTAIWVTPRNSLRYTTAINTTVRANPTAEIGAIAAANVRYGIREKAPIIMFWGFPVIVAALPILAAMATASRYGIGLRRRRVTMSITRGVRTRHIVSFTKKAEKPPETTTMAVNRARG